MSDETPLILLPGLLCDDASWTEVAEELACDWRIMDVPPLETIEEIAHVLLADLPDRFALAGHSMGGYIALEMLRQAPARIERLAFVASMADPDGPDLIAARKRLIERVDAGEFEEIAVTLSKMMVPRSQEDADWFRAKFVEMAHRIGPEKFIAHQKAVMTRADRLDTARTFEGPCLIVGAEDDAVTLMDRMQKLASAMKDANFVRLSGGGHLPVWTRPFDVANAIDAWLTD